MYVWQYSFSIVVAGAVIEKISGQTYVRRVREIFLIKNFFFMISIAMAFLICGEHSQQAI